MPNATDAQFEAALIKSAGNYTVAAQHLKTTRQAVGQRVRGNMDKWGPVLLDIKEMLKDGAESAVAQAIMPARGKPDMPTVRWYLQQQARDRGYASATQVDFSDDAIEKLVSGIGGDVERLRSLRGRVDQES